MNQWEMEEESVTPLENQTETLEVPRQGVATTDDSDEYIPESNRPPKDEREGVPTSDEIRDDFLAALAKRAEDTIRGGAEMLRQQALLAHQFADDNMSMRLLSSIFQRNAGYMARAVERQPEWFTYDDDDNPQIDSTVEELLILFAIQQVKSDDKYNKIYAWWRNSHPDTRIWYIQEMVMTLNKRAPRMSKALRIKDATITRHNDHIEIRAGELPEADILVKAHEVIIPKIETEQEVLEEQE